MIPIPSGVKVWIATGVTDMRRGMNGLSLQVQEAFGRDPHAGDLYVFRGRRGDLVKILWHDGLGLSLYAKRLDGALHWPSAAGGLQSRQRNSDLLSDRLAQPATYLAAAERRIGLQKKLAEVQKGTSQITDFMILSEPWTPALNRCQTTSES
jgi:transposase